MDFAILADAFQRLEETSGRLEMTSILAELFKKAPAKEIDRIIYLLQGRVAPPFKPIEIGMGEKFVEQAIALASGYKPADVLKGFKESGDLGLVAEKLLSKKKQRSLFGQKLTVAHVFDVFYKIATVSGSGSQDLKIKSLTELLNNASPVEAKFLARIPLGQLRMGIGDPTILDAFSQKEVGDKSLREPLERAYNLCSDLGLVARVFWEDGIGAIKKFRIKVGNPIRPALAERLPSSADIVKKLGKCAVESKYDGLRLAIHKNGKEVSIFSRRLEDMTAMFPEVVKAAQALPQKQLIFEGEALSFNEATGEYYPFQVTMQRKRKHGVAKSAEDFPLKIFAFDILLLDGKDLTQKPFRERRKLLERVIGKRDTLRLSDIIYTDDSKKLEKYFEQSVSAGLEGIMAKDLNAPYVAGARKFAWIKLKRSYRGELRDTVDAVIVGYFKGAGARAEFMGSLLTAVYDEKEGVFKTIAKVGSGMSEEQMLELRGLLEKSRLKHRHALVDSLIEPDFWVEPRYVITLTADEITESPMHTAGRVKETGYALRFPRMLEYRFDRKPDDATTVREIIWMFKQQRRVSTEPVQGEA